MCLCVCVCAWCCCCCFCVPAAGLYYLAELAEEYPTYAQRAIRYTIMGLLGLHLVLLVGDLSAWRLLLGAGAHAVYFSLLKQFPDVSLTSLPFIGSMCKS